MRILILCLSLLLSGCNLAHLAQSGSAASLGSLTGTLVTGGNPVGAAVGAGVATVTVEILDPLEVNRDDITKVPEEDRAAVLKNRDMWLAIESLGLWVLGIFVLIWLIPDPFTIIRRLLMK